jgi:glutathionylspermidine synthase
MVEEIRQAYNAAFNPAAYQQLLAELNQDLPRKIEFRVAETPVFLDAAFKRKLITAGDELVSVIRQENFKQLTESAIPENWRVAHDKGHPHFLTFDFAVCRAGTGELVPKLIELQGFPSLYGFQAELAQQYQKHFPVTQQLSPYFSNLNPESYFELLRRTILGKHSPQEVILLDINAPEQKTAVDFYITARHLGIAVVALHELYQQGNQIFYNRHGQDYRVKKIYNRLIFDEIEDKQEAFRKVPDLLTTNQVKWVTHPNWFYRISKYTMPFLKSQFVPQTWFLSDLKTIPENLAHYVLKPLFSFAGQGVIIDVSEADIQAIPDPENWILQEKVTYEPVIKAPDAEVKCEIRLMYLWPDGEAEPNLAISLARLSRGKMIGVRYNQNFDWVGGSICLF